MRRRSIPAAVAAFAASAALLAACGTATDAGEPESADSFDLTGSWELVSGSGPDGDIDPVADKPVSLVVDDEGAVSGDGGCNGYGGTVTVEESSVTFDELMSTLMYCTGGISEVENAYMSALDDVQTGSRDGDDLLLTGDGVELRFTQTGDAPSSS